MKRDDDPESTEVRFGSFVFVIVRSYKSFRKDDAFAFCFRASTTESVSCLILFKMWPIPLCRTRVLTAPGVATGAGAIAGFSVCPSTEVPHFPDAAAWSARPERRRPFSGTSTSPSAASRTETERKSSHVQVSKPPFDKSYRFLAKVESNAMGFGSVVNQNQFF